MRPWLEWQTARLKWQPGENNPLCFVAPTFAVRFRKGASLSKFVFNLDMIPSRSKGTLCYNEIISADSHKSQLSVTHTGDVSMRVKPGRPNQWMKNTVINIHILRKSILNLVTVKVSSPFTLASIHILHWYYCTIYKNVTASDIS